VTNAGRIWRGKNPLERNNFEDQKRDGTITLRWIFRRSVGVEGDWSCLRIVSNYGLSISGEELPDSAIGISLDAPH
jgi:hypothetical protein